MHRTTGTGIPSQSNDSALRGATIAFRATPSPSNKNATLSSSSRGGALAAASKVGTGPSPPWKPTASLKQFDGTDSSDAALAAYRFPLQRSHSVTEGAVGYIAPPYRETSPANIAATRAASRSRPPPIHNTIFNGNGQRSKMSSQTSLLTEGGTDETPIPSTNRLVELFEAKQRSELKSPKESKAEVDRPKHDNIVSPKPIRPALAVRIRAPTDQMQPVPDPMKASSPIRTVLPTDTPVKKRASISTISTISTKPAASAPLQKSKSRTLPAIPPSAAPSKTKPAQVKPIVMEKAPASNSQSMPPPTTQSQRLSTKTPPKLPPPRRRRPASVAPTSEAGLTLTRTASTPPVLPRRFTQMPPGKLKPQLTADSLANAMVASSLASSRAPSPTHSSRPDTLSRSQSTKHHGFASFLLLHSPTYSPSPPKLPPSRPPGLRQTLRPSPSSSDEESNSKRRSQQHRHGFLIKKHPNKHAEGTRRHWHNSITEPERKRYEGVWAANRGILIQQELANDSSAEQDDVHGFVVREIYSRSGLGERVLSEIWELVESGGRVQRERQSRQASISHDPTLNQRRGRLKRHEFVVGLWLVDQCLKGRKLPVEVQESVWNSAKGLMSGLRAR